MCLGRGGEFANTCSHPQLGPHCTRERDVHGGAGLVPATFAAQICLDQPGAVIDLRRRGQWMRCRNFCTSRQPQLLLECRAAVRLHDQEMDIVR